jgi:CubicO group peptidase (beta-lactamase class C family)
MIESGEVRDLSSILVIRQGYLVLEEYFNGSSRGDVHTMQSVTKSVTSLIVGAAVDARHLRTSDAVSEILPASYASAFASDPRKQRITVEHLLQMRAGINFYESPYPGSPLERLNTSNGDWTMLALSEPMNAEPGERWQYNSGGVIALAAVVRAATGQRFDLFAAEKLFTPIGVTTQQWTLSPFDQLPHAGGGLRLRAVDLARVGYLVLRRGAWGSQRVISEDWINRSVQPITRQAVNYGGSPADYGYLWYQYPLSPGGTTTDWNNVIIAATGNLTQWLFIVPRDDLVMVVTGIGNRSFSEPLWLLKNLVLTAVER